MYQKNIYPFSDFSIGKLFFKVSGYVGYNVDKKLSHCQILVKEQPIFINGDFIKKNISIFLTSSKSSKILNKMENNLIVPNLELYEDKSLYNGFQHLNINEPLIADSKLFEQIFTLNEHIVCDNILKEIYKNDCFNEIRQATVNIVENYKDHYKFHKIIKDTACELCTNFVEFTVSPNGQVISTLLKGIF